MRTTVDIDKSLLEEAFRLTRAKTTKELIHRSLAELVRRGRIDRLRAKLGRVELDLDRDSLDRWRAGE